MPPSPRPADGSTRPTVLVIGAGKIGRGLLGEMFSAPTAGGPACRVRFDDIDGPLLAALRRRRAYQIVHATVEGSRRVRVDGFEVVDGNDPSAVAEAVAGADLVATAVGARCLADVAPALAEGFRRRAERTAEPLDCLVCENLARPGRRLRDLVVAAAEQARAAGRPALDPRLVGTRFGLAGAVVNRAVPVPPSEVRRRDPLALLTDGAPGLWVDGRALCGPRDRLASVPDLHIVDDFAAYQQRKLLLHNMAHAVCAYLGHRRGHRLLWRAMEDPVVAETVRGAMEEAGRALVRRFGFDPAEMRAYQEDLLRRFRLRAIGDRVARVAADPIRKLGPDDRLIGAARLCLEEGLEPDCIVHGIRAALAYDHPEDPSAARLQETLAQSGLPGVLREVCGLLPGEPLFARILESDASERR